VSGIEMQTPYYWVKGGFGGLLPEMSETGAQNISGKGEQNVANFANLQATGKFILDMVHMKNKRPAKITYSRCKPLLRRVPKK
jgi:hypothetical protein